ncbi:DUF3301 domain-containing protein [Candidatus Albibeggiatoa sp. nov. BB20]|uniref:DUF3301 domain-containing protein n=1 Tax=Candidatus Albibeggiatoa sp. nov. BB20 TaxID=3162723 RepID=UPI003365982B
MSLTSILFLLFLGAITWFWFDSLRVLEIARTHSKRICAQYHLQLLDDSISLTGINLARNKLGHVVLQRDYRFEFHHQGEDVRIQAGLIMRGTQLMMVDVPEYMDRTFFQA